MVIIKQPARPLAPLLRVQPAKCHQCGGKIKQGEYASLVASAGRSMTWLRPQIVTTGRLQQLYADYAAAVPL